MGLPAPPPMPRAVHPSSHHSLRSGGSVSSSQPVPDWQRDPHGFLDYHDNQTLRKDATVFVQLHNLQQRPELNGKLALVVGFEPSIQRYRVQLTQAITYNNNNNNNQNNNNESTATATAQATSVAPILSVKPSSIQKANFGQQILGQVQIVYAQRLVIFQSIQGWLKTVIPMGIVAGNMGPTDHEMAHITMTFLWTTLVLVGIIFLYLLYRVGATKAMVLTTFVITVGMLVGPEMVNREGRQQSSKATLVRLGGRLSHLVADLVPLVGSHPRPEVVGLVTLLWCSYVAWVLFMT